MQLRKTPAFVLYVGSYLPLSMILSSQDLDLGAPSRGFCNPATFFQGGCELPLLHPAWALGTVGLGALCLLATLWTLGGVRTPHRVRIVEAKHIPADLINYAIPYVVSFMGLDFGSPTKLFGFGVFFLWIFWITYKSGQIVMNPILVVFGWRLYEIKYTYLQSVDELIGRTLAQVEIELGVEYRQGSVQDVMILREQE